MMSARRLKGIFIVFLFAMLVTSAMQAALGEGGGGGEGGNPDPPGGEGGEGGSGNQTQEQQQGGNETQEQQQSGNQTQNGSCEQNEGEGCGNCSGNQEQNQDQAGGGNQTQNQEQNGGCGECQGDGCGNCSRNQEQQQGGNQTQNQEQNGGCGECQGDGCGNCSGNQEQNQDQAGGGNQTQNQEQNGGGTRQGQEQQGQQNQNQNGEGNGSGDGEGHTWQHRYRNEIQSGIENGTLVMESTFTYRNRYMLQENNHYQLGMEIEYQGKEGNTVRFRVRAEFQEGKVVALNIGENVLRFRNQNQFKVYFDGKQIQAGNAGEVVKGNGTQAKYAGEVGEGGAQFLVYIPHFSEHIIEIESLTELAEEQLFSGSNYAVMGFAILALVGLSAHVYSIGNRRD